LTSPRDTRGRAAGGHHDSHGDRAASQRFT
jgi:hypothetical protein